MTTRSPGIPCDLATSPWLDYAEVQALALHLIRGTLSSEQCQRLHLMISGDVVQPTPLVEGFLDALAGRQPAGRAVGAPGPAFRFGNPSRAQFASLMEMIRTWATGPESRSDERLRSGVWATTLHVCKGHRGLTTVDGHLVPFGFDADTRYGTICAKSVFTHYTITGLVWPLAWCGVALLMAQMARGGNHG